MGTGATISQQCDLRSRRFQQYDLSSSLFLRSANVFPSPKSVHSFLNRICGTRACGSTPPLLQPSHYCDTKGYTVGDKNRNQHPPPSNHIRNPAVDLLAFACINQGKVENCFHPCFWCPLKLRIVNTHIVGRYGFADMLACCSVRYDEDEYQCCQCKENSKKLENRKCRKTLKRLLRVSGVHLWQELVVVNTRLDRRTLQATIMPKTPKKNP